MIDCHLHTSFSPDSDTAPEALIERAIELGLKYIAVTDHTDINQNWRFDPAAYFAKLTPLKQKHANKIYVAIGIEAGWTPDSQAEMAGIINSHPFDYVINSVHAIKGSECYWRPHFKGRSRETVYNEYYEAITDSLDADFRFDTVGHLHYIMRNAPYPDRIFEYSDFAPVLDKLLGKIISYGKILEYNTNDPATFPAVDQIFARYYTLGGRKVCFSSDAHTADRVAYGYDRTVKALKGIGFGYWTAVQSGKHTQIVM